MSTSPFDPNRKVTIELFAADAFVLNECLSRYQDSDPQVLQPNASEYAALMHVLGPVELWVEYESGLPPGGYQAAVETAYDDLSEPRELCPNSRQSTTPERAQAHPRRPRTAARSLTRPIF
jgi:hypothetical protein